MATEQRKQRRASLRHVAHVLADNGTEQHVCIVRDVSDTGARLQFTDAAAVPNRFTLALRSRYRPRRRCRVVWRTDKELGVEFTAPARK